jgi:hypothetical protein
MTALATVERFFTTYYTGDAAATREAMTEDFTLVGPFATANNADEFFEVAEGLLKIVRGHHMLRSVGNGNDVATLYEILIQAHPDRRTRLRLTPERPDQQPAPRPPPLRSSGAVRRPPPVRSAMPDPRTAAATPCGRDRAAAVPLLPPPGPTAPRPCVSPSAPSRREPPATGWRWVRRS